MNSRLKFALLLAAMSMLLIVSYFLRNEEHPSPHLYSLARDVEIKLGEIHEQYHELVSDTSLINDLTANQFASDNLQGLSDKPFMFLIYHRGECVFWNSNKVFPATFLAVNIGDGSNFVRLENGYYEIIKTTWRIDLEKVVLIGLVPIKDNFSIQNNYLKNQFNPIFDLPSYVDVSLSPIAGGEPVQSQSGSNLFYLNLKDDAYKNLRFNYATIGLCLGAFIFLLLSIHFFSQVVVMYSNTIVGILFLSVSLLIVRWITLVVGYPNEISDLALFSPTMYASSAINKSLGDLLINIILIFWVSLYFFRNVRIKLRVDDRAFLNYFFSFLAYTFIFIMAYVVGEVFRSLIVDSTIPFDFNDFLNLNGFSLIGLMCFAFVLLGYLLVTFRLLRAINKSGAADRNKFYLLLSCLFLSTTLLFVLDYPLINLVTACWTFVFILFLHRIIAQRREVTALTSVVSLLVLFSFLSAAYIHHYNTVKELEERKSFARKLKKTSEGDPVTEYLFLDVQERILRDAFVKNYFLQPFISTQEIVERIKAKYLLGYFSRYDISIFTLNREGDPIQSDIDSYVRLLNDDMIQDARAISDNLFYIPRPFGNYTYVGNLPIFHRNKLVGAILLELDPKSYAKTNLYPELLLEEKIKPSKEFEKYNYGVYTDGRLNYKNGGYPYDYKFNYVDSLTQEYTSVEEGDLEHLVYTIGDNKIVVITSEEASIIQPISLFSYLFCIYLFFGFIVILIRVTVFAVRDQLRLKDTFSLTFKDKIQFSMIFVIVISFFIIGIVTVLNFTKQYDSYHKGRLIRKEKAVRTAIEYIIAQDENFLETRDFSNPKWQQQEVTMDLSAISDIHSMDINIYSLEGRLINSSQPDIFEKGLLSKIIEPVAYRNMKLFNKSQFMQEEHIGSLDYLSIYTPVRNRKGELAAYLNLPYFAKEKELNKEISSFLVALINVYVLLLVLGGFLAYILSDSITRSLTAISQKLKFVQLGKKNKPIEWKGNDEIGVLVGEYNKMIMELEESASLLAKSEREDAWREMAKQIAHEIKNPLTPMKLSIQHLQRAILENRPNVNQMADRVAETLIEQIDNLTHIATEFSNFAKMPKGQFDRFDLYDVVQSVVNLFQDDINVSIKFVRVDHDCMVFADRKQILRVFNNLIKNAIQAIPDDAEGRIRISLYRSGSFVRVEVKDNGVGIPEEQKSKVFVPKFTTKGSGMGLGLAITQQIIENANGKIWFESTVDVGTTFIIELPLH